MSTHTHIRFWLAMVAAMFLLTPLLRDTSAMDAFVEQEVQMTRDTFGEKVSDFIASNAAGVYKLLPGEKIGQAKIEGERMRRTKQVVPGAGVAVTVAYNKYVTGLVQMFYVATMRSFILMVWMMVLAPVLIASVVDGFTQRAIKRAEFGAIRPAAYTVTSLVVVPLAVAPLFYLVLPFSISPLVTPMWSLVIAIPLALMVSNMQPIFGKN